MYQLSSNTKALEPFYSETHTRWCNFGGPPYRIRNSRIRTTLFGDEKKTISWRRCLRVGLVFEERQSPLEYLEDLLVKSGFGSPEELRAIHQVPAGSLACRVVEGETKDFINVSSASAEEILRQALLLGLCGSDFYNSKRPVIWTRSRLVRHLELYETGDFYADN